MNKTRMIEEKVTLKNDNCSAVLIERNGTLIKSTLVLNSTNLDSGEDDNHYVFYCTDKDIHRLLDISEICKELADHLIKHLRIKKEQS